MNESQLQNLLQTSKYLIGKRQTLRELIESCADIRCIVIAQDTEKHISASIVDVCKLNNVSYECAFTKKELGKFAKIKVDCSMICFLK